MPEAARRARVVVVDDSRFQRELARRALEREVEVECCPDGEAALEALHREPAELVVSDLTMPGLSGLDLLARVHREHPGTDFVILTAHATVESAVEALRRGATDYLQKPLGPEDLVLAVERTLARRRLVDENARLRDERAVLEACRTLAACLEPEDAYSAALDLILRATGRRRAVALYHRESIPSSDGVQLRGFDEGEEALLRERLSGEKPIDFEQALELCVTEAGPVRDALEETGLASGRVLAVPVRGEEIEGGLLGVLEEGRPFRDEELERAALVASHASIALCNAERYARAKGRAFVDDVTSVYNARYLVDALDTEVRRAKRYGGPLSVLFLDVDRFKLVNDRHGHLVGSHALREIAQVLGDCVRQVDTLARYGGDEFTILLLDTDAAGAEQVGERIRAAVEEALLGGGRGSGFHVTCSVGVATYPQHGTSRERLLDAADKAMYRAKSKGRNHVCTADELG